MFKNFLKPFLGRGPAAPADVPQPDAQGLIVEGNAAEDAGRLDEARALYERAAALAPDLPAAHLNLGIAQAALGAADLARASFERVLTLDSRHAAGAYNLARLEYMQGDLAAAEALLRGALASKPDFVDAWVLQSNVLDGLGRLQDAAFAMQRAVQLHPDYPGALYNQAGLLHRLGRLDEAEAAAARAATLDPDNPECLALHGFLLAAQGLSAEALASIRKAIEHAPERFNFRGRALFLENLLEDTTAQELAAQHRELGALLEAAVPPREQPAPHFAQAAPAPRLCVR